MPSFVSLVGLRSRALCKGVWYRINPAARALIDAAILYLRRGGRIKSQASADAIRRAAEEGLALATPVRLLAKTVGHVIARVWGIAVDEETAVALGLQWQNTPKRWRSDAAKPLGFPKVSTYARRVAVPAPRSPPPRRLCHPSGPPPASRHRLRHQTPRRPRPISAADADVVDVPR